MQVSDLYKQVLLWAEIEAHKLEDWHISTEHLLLALLHLEIVEPNVVTQLFSEYGVDGECIRESIKSMRPSTKCRVPEGATEAENLSMEVRAKHAISLAYDEARQYGHIKVEPEHILLGLIRERDGVGGRVLLQLNFKLEPIRRAVLRLRSA